MDVNPTAKSELLTQKDLWFCTCGAVNRLGENTCHCCGTDLSAIKNTDQSGLSGRCDERLAKEREAAAKAAEKAEKKTKCILSIAIPAVIAVIAIFLVVTKIVIPNSNYNAAVELMDSGKYEEAMATFEAMDGYSDSENKIEECKKAINDVYKAELKLLQTASVGDTVRFGTYEQDNDTSNGAEGIEWQVLAKENNKVLVISKYALDCQQYNTSDTDVTWETCTLRTWLNGTFLDSAFTATEQAAIAQTTVTPDKNPERDTDPGNATTDKTFLLSIDEANKYFSSDSARQCEATAYAVANGVMVSYSGDWWWLRSPGDYQSDAAYVSGAGSVSCDGRSVHLGAIAVRPALWINLDS